MAKELSEMSLEELWQLFPIILTEHKIEWDEWYREESKALETILTEIDVARISQIGSTAIEKIWAKPTVDILIELRNPCDKNTVKSLLQKNGYLCMSESDTRMTFNKGYTKYGFAKRVFHIHIRFLGDHDELYFRDYMNENESLAKEYEKLKLSLWKKYEHDRDAYTEAKGEFVRKYTAEARLIYGNRYEEA